MAGGKWALGRLFRTRNATGWIRGLLQGPSKLFWTPKPQRTVGSDGVIVNPPGFDAAPGLSQIQKPLFVQTGITQFAVKTLH